MNDEKPDNLAIWNQVCTTDPSATKSYKGPGGFNGTAINAISVIEKATALFGPIGIGWGYNILEDTFVEGGPLFFNDEQPDLGSTPHKTHTIKLELWASVGDKVKVQTQVVNYGHTPYVYKNKYGIQTDGEYAKKSLTDAIKKCLSMLGFNADVYHGLYDDHNYVEYMQRKEDVDKSEDKAAVIVEQQKEYKDWKAKNLDLIKSSVNLNELQALFTSCVKKAQMNKDDSFIREVTIAKDKRKEELEPGEVS